MEPKTKISQVKAAAAAGDWAGALRIAARFPQLGEHKRAIVTAHECVVHPDFYRQLGKDPQRCIDDGVAALRQRYGI